MASYDYKAGKKRVKEILDNKLEVIEQNKLPSIENLTFDNAYKSWVSAIFVDIRDSTALFTEEDKEKISKIIRSFTSEIIEILRDDNNLREIGIRGDCVYAIYTTPFQSDIYECVNKAIYVNTYLRMLNKLLLEKKYPTITAGIGVGSAIELIVKAGRKGVDINNPVWIGDAVTGAANLSSIANKDGHDSIAFSESTYSNMIEKMREVDSEKDVDSWLTKYSNDKLGTYYCAGIVKSEFNDWINNGMED
ncbi:MAG: adenylate/guanylate cyclase domain-containing protein [Roseburia sp.]